VSGLQDVTLLERDVRALSEAVDENALLEPGLERRVAELETTLLSVLSARHRGLGTSGDDAASASSSST
jgi:hypothetical protein